MRLVHPFALHPLRQWQKVASRLQHPSPSRPWHPLRRPRRHAGLPLLRRAVQPRPLAPRCPSRARLATAHLRRHPRPLSAPFPAWQQFPFPQAAVPFPSRAAVPFPASSGFAAAPSIKQRPNGIQSPFGRSSFRPCRRHPWRPVFPHDLFLWFCSVSMVARMSLPLPCRVPVTTTRCE